jgi:hypothetical protein
MAAVAFALAALLSFPAAASALDPGALVGAVGDARCNVEEVQSANEHQLHEILSELTNTTYFRLFQVDLNRPCKFWRKPEDAGDPEEDPNAQSCSAPPFADDSGASSSSSSSSAALGGGIGASSAFGGIGPAGSDGGPEPPTMCSLDLASKDPQEMRWAPPTTPVDATLSRQEHRAVHRSADAGAADCAEEDHPEFWLDMCQTFEHADPGAEYVNLLLNPERWTGYNGSHVWSAIYDENCLRGVRSVDDMCYEERVLYRLLSGMHTAVNVHVALKAKMPKKNVPGREDWSADPARFVRQYGEHPERLRNLHFSFVVLLRALRKAAPALQAMDLTLGQDPEEDRRVRLLMRRLLDTHILSSCSNVFGAFDESALFKAAETAAKEAKGPGGAEEEAGDRGGGDVGGLVARGQPSLKSQFKGVFHNISEVMDCISCQKCKLHGKLQLLGLGTALKVLLLPEHLHGEALTRSEVVALVNTVSKFSHAILQAPRLAEAAKREQPPEGFESAGEKHRPSAEAQPEGTAVPEPPKGGRDPASPPRSSGDGLELERGRAWDEATTASLVDAAVRATAEASAAGVIGPAAELALLDAALNEDARVLVLARHYEGEAFAKRATRILDAGGGGGGRRRGEGDERWGRADAEA